MIFGVEAFEQADDGKHDPRNDDDPRIVERLAEPGDDVDRVEAAWRTKGALLDP